MFVCATSLRRQLTVLTYIVVFKKYWSADIEVTVDF